MDVDQPREPKKTILVTGFWPPTNALLPEGMLARFAAGEVGRAGIGETVTFLPDSDVAVVSISPTYPNGIVHANWGNGEGAWRVEYAAVAETFWRLAVTYQPVAILGFGRTPSPTPWEFELGAMNLVHEDWRRDATGKRPPVGGTADDPASGVLQGIELPNYGREPAEGHPPDASFPGKEVRVSPLLLDLLNGLKSQMGDEVSIGPPMGTTENDQFLCAYTGYLLSWYQNWSETQAQIRTCQAAWFTHVSGSLPVPDARKLFELQLGLLIETLPNF